LIFGRIPGRTNVHLEIILNLISSDKCLECAKLLGNCIDFKLSVFIMSVLNQNLEILSFYLLQKMCKQDLEDIVCVCYFQHHYIVGFKGAEKLSTELCTQSWLDVEIVIGGRCC